MWPAGENSENFVPQERWFVKAGNDQKKAAGSPFPLGRSFRLMFNADDVRKCGAGRYLSRTRHGMPEVLSRNGCF